MKITMKTFLLTFCFSFAICNAMTVGSYQNQGQTQTEAQRVALYLHFYLNNGWNYPFLTNLSPLEKQIHPVIPNRFMPPIPRGEF